MESDRDTFFDVENPPLQSSGAAVMVAYSKGIPLSEEKISDGPSRIRAASKNLELYDEEIDFQAADKGIHTIREPLVTCGPGKASASEHIRSVLDMGVFPVVIGDNLRICAVSLHAVRAAFPETSSVLVTGSLPSGGFWSGQEPGSSNNPVGIMGLKSSPRMMPPGLVALATSRELVEQRTEDPWLGVGATVHLMVHPDVFEPAILPSPSNSEPGGLDWWTAIDLLRKLFSGRRVVGLDLCGYRPPSDSVISDFTLAKLVYKVIGYALGLPKRSSDFS